MCPSFGSFLLILLVTLTSLPAANAQTETANTAFSVLWSKSAPPIVSLSISPAGKSIAMITSDGKLAVWDGSAGDSLWSVPHINAHSVNISDGVGYVLTYDLMNPLNRTVTLFKAKLTQKSNQRIYTPQRAWQDKLDGAVWCADVSPNSEYATCGTGSRQVYLFGLKPHPRVTKHQIDGICNDIEFAPNGQFVAVGMWNQSGVETLDLLGRIRWSFLASNYRRYNVSISPDGGKVIGISNLIHNASAPVITLFDDLGNIRWTYALPRSSYGANALIGNLAQSCVVSYTKLTERENEPTPERSLLALNPVGDIAWEKGGLFFSPNLLCFTSDAASVIVTNSAETLYRLDYSGHVTAHFKLPGQIQLWAVSHDRKKLAVYTSDGTISLIRIG